MFIDIYDRNAAGLAEVVLTRPCGSQEVIATGPSITQARAGLGSLKEQLGIRMAPVRTRKGEVFGASAMASSVVLPTFSINERFDMMADIIDEVVDGELNAAVIVGRGGTGKSHTVFERIEAAGYVRIQNADSAPMDKDEDEDGPAEGETLEFVKEYVLVKGGVSATDLFKLLFNNRNRLVVFDDSDTCIEDEIRQNLLKAVLDTYDVREVTWLSQFLRNQGYPTAFEFTGKVVFISNKKMADFPQAIKSRALLLDLDMTNAELVERVRNIAHILLPNLDPEARTQLVDFIDVYRDALKDLSIRTFQTAAPLMKRANWQSLVLYSA